MVKAPSRLADRFVLPVACVVVLAACSGSGGASNPQSSGSTGPSGSSGSAVSSGAAAASGTVTAAAGMTGASTGASAASGSAQAGSTSSGTSMVDDAAAPEAASTGTSGASMPDASSLDGNGGSGSSGSTPEAGAALPRRSAGCGKVVTDAATVWATHDIMVTVDPQFAPMYNKRRYFTRPPPNYDPNKAYPLTIWGQGCGQSVAETTPITMGPGAANSVQVQMLAEKAGGCYSAGPDGDNANSPELPYFDLVLAQAEAEFCIDETKVFMGGYSSGGWFTSLISCNRTSVVRGVGWVAAGLQLNHAPCTGPVAGLVTVGSMDPGTPMAQAIAGRDSLIMRNGCGATTVPWDPGETTFDSSSCVSYQGCMPGYPVVWCLTPGGHSNGLNTGLSSKGFWKLWSSLP